MWNFTVLSDDFHQNCDYLLLLLSLFVVKSSVTIHAVFAFSKKMIIEICSALPLTRTRKFG